MEQELNHLEELTRKGQSEAALKRLTELTQKGSCPRPFRSRLAALARRLDAAHQGIQILNSTVRPSHRKPNDATPMEKAEYAACLIDIGAPEEGILLLDPLESTSVPERRLYIAFGLMNQWKYAEAARQLEEYLSQPGLDDYRRLVGGVNLAASWIAVRELDKSDTLLSSLLPNCKTQDRRLIRGNLLELATQVAVFRKDRIRAEGHLQESLELLKESSSRYEFFARKWKVILSVVFETRSAKTELAVEEIKKEARARNLWENIRHLDRVMAVAWKDPVLATHLYFGTPHLDFRQRLISDLEDPLNLPSEYLWKTESNPFLTGDRERLDPTPQIDLGKTLQVLSGQSQVLLSTLASDFYRPFRAAELHFRMYPKDHYNPNTSPNRVHQSVKRLRATMDKQLQPLQVVETGGRYCLSADTELNILIPNLKEAASPSDSVMAQLRKQTMGRPFSITEASQWLSIPKRTALRTINTAVQEGKLIKEGRSRSTTYRFLKG